MRYIQVLAAALIWMSLAGSATAVSWPSGRTNSNHDFDYEFGAWNVRVSRLVKPPDGPPHWVAYAGTHRVTPLWNGRANIGVLEIKGAAGSIEGLQLRLYDPGTKQWSLSFASSVDGLLGIPLVGSFHHGVGIFCDREQAHGNDTLVRAVSRTISTTSYRDVISQSSDGGKTWTPVWIATYDKQS